MPLSVVICVLCLFAGAALSARWLPDLAPGAIGGLALCVVSGLLGITLAIIGLHIYDIVQFGNQLGLAKGTLLTGELTSMLADAATPLGLAAVVYLLAAPRANATAGSVAVADPVADPPA